MLILALAGLLNLPQEIVDDIVDNLQDDRAILITLLPVSRSLHSRAQVYLFPYHKNQAHPGLQYFYCFVLPVHEDTKARQNTAPSS